MRTRRKVERPKKGQNSSDVTTSLDDPSGITQQNTNHERRLTAFRQGEGTIICVLEEILNQVMFMSRMLLKVSGMAGGRRKASRSNSESVTFRHFRVNLGLRSAI